MEKYKDYFQANKMNLENNNSNNNNYINKYITNNNNNNNQNNHLINNPYRRNPINNTNNNPYTNNHYNNYNNPHYYNYYNNYYNNPEFIINEENDSSKIYTNELIENDSIDNNNNKDKENMLRIQFKYRGNITSINANKNITIENLFHQWAIKKEMNNELETCIFIYKNIVLSNKSQKIILNYFKNNDLIEVINYKYLI